MDGWMGEWVDGWWFVVLNCVRTSIGYHLVLSLIGCVCVDVMCNLVELTLLGL